VKSHHYSLHAAALRTELGHTLTREQMRTFHTKDAWRHFLVAARQFAILGLTTWALIAISNPFIWIPLVFVQGFTVFNFTVLLHEVVHHTIFTRRRPAAERALGWLYAVPSGISASQFTRWHLDHHAELGSDEDDPKRHHLSPKINARWFKLHCSLALFPIYFRAARLSATYPEALQQRIASEQGLDRGPPVGAG
jgi:fatty acid desaturase